VTSFVRGVAGALTVVEALWMFYAYFDSPKTVASCLNSCPYPGSIVPNDIIPGLAVVILLVGALGVWGASPSYLLGAALSAAALLLMGYTVAVTSGDVLVSNVTNDALVGVAFALVALIVDFQAMRMKSRISEQANPMNLPVFG